MLEHVVQCERCAVEGAARTMRRPHGHGWWCQTCLADYELYRRTNTRTLARRIGIPSTNPWLLGLALLGAAAVSGTLGFGGVVAAVYAAPVLLILGVRWAKRGRRAFLVDQHARLPTATLASSTSDPKSPEGG